MGKIICLYRDEGGKMIIEGNKTNMVKLSKLVLYFANNSTTRLYKTKLNKLLFYTQFLCYKLYNIRLLEDEFICDFHGPVLNCIDYYLNRFSDLKIINLVETDYGLTIESKFNMPIDQYTKEEQDILPQVLKKFDSYTVSDMSEYSHKESLWLNTGIKNIIDIERADELIELFS